MFYALIAYVLTECMAYANCSINLFIVLYVLFILVICIRYKKTYKLKKTNDVKAEHRDASAFICICIIIFVSGILGHVVMSRGLEIKTEVYKVYKPARNEGNFDERKYKLGIQTVFDDKIGLINPTIYPKYLISIMNSYMKELQIIKEEMGKRIENNCDERTASIYKALLIGDKTSINEEDKRLFRVAGISHVFAISGLHISLLGIGLYKLLRKKFMMPFSVCVSIFLVINYSLMIGISVSTTRAIVMFSLRMIAEVCGKKYDEINGFIISLIIVCSIYPWGFITFSFQMSFAAVFVCYFIIPKVNDFLKINSRIISTVVASLVLNIILNILIAYNYYEIYPYTVITNIIILPFMGMVIIMGFLGFYKIGGFFIKTGIKLCDGISVLVNSQIICGKPEVWQIICAVAISIVYLIIIKMYERQDYKFKIDTGDFNDYKDEIAVSRKKKIITIVVYVLLFADISFGYKIKESIFYELGFYKNEINMAMVDIGQGDFIYLKTEHGYNITIDGGSSDIKDVAKSRMVPFLKYRGVDVIDYAFISHSDDDHCNGIMDIIMNYEIYGIKVRNIVIAKLDNRDEALINIINTANEYGVHECEMEEGDKLMEFTCVMPYKNLEYEDVNEASLVLSYECSGFSALFTGDFNGDENYLFNNIRKYTDIDRYTILKVAHHGSKFSTKERILRNINPEYAWISCGVNNRYGHPASELMERIKKYTNAKVYVTKETGEIKYVKAK